MCPSREAKGEALTGERIGCRRYSREIVNVPDVDHMGRYGKTTADYPLTRGYRSGAVVGGGMCVRTMHGSREPSFMPGRREPGRKGKPVCAIRRCT